MTLIWLTVVNISVWITMFDFEKARKTKIEGF